MSLLRHSCVCYCFCFPFNFLSLIFFWSICGYYICSYHCHWSLPAEASDSCICYCFSKSFHSLSLDLFLLHNFQLLRLTHILSFFSTPAHFHATASTNVSFSWFCPPPSGHQNVTPTHAPESAPLKKSCAHHWYTYTYTQCCGSVFIFYGSGSGLESWIRIRFRIPDPSQYYGKKNSFVNSIKFENWIWGQIYWI